MFRNEVAVFLNTDPEKIQLATRLDSFMQLDSLGIVAMLIRLEKRFNLSFRDFIGASIETFSDLYEFLAEKTQTAVVSDKPVTSLNALPPMLDYSNEALQSRQDFVRSEMACEDFSLPLPESPQDYAGNIEGFAGFVQIPVGISGPLKVRGQYAEGDFYLPLATTEGALVSSVARGCHIISMSGGAEVRIIDDSIVRTPVFVFSSLAEQQEFSLWVKENLAAVKDAAHTTTRHGKLLEIEQFPIGTQLILRFVYSTGDASGQNMTTIATRTALDFILKNYHRKFDDWFLESNLSGDKKINSVNFTSNRGKKVVAVCRIPADIIRKNLHTTVDRMCRLADLSMITSIQAHAFGVQAHYANILAAVYIAAGQDPACVAESAAGITHLQKIGEDLQISVTLPGLMVGTVGGGTRLPTQNNCLKLMRCAGAGNAGKFAEILAAAVLAGEISIIGAMAADEFTDAHARYGRNSARTGV
jgi:hydroxymethylglutaryl-CoA reductase (NADPH)